MDYNEQLRNNYFKMLNDKQRRIAELSLESKVRLLDRLIYEGIFTIVGREDYFIILHNLEDHSDKIPIGYY